MRFLFFVILSVFFIIGTSQISLADQFPKDFRWCVATAAHQIEGGNFKSDWWEWEKTPGHFYQNQSSDPADDHWNRVEEDIELLKALHVNEYRFSVEWAKVEPESGQIDEAVLQHYAHEVQLLRKAGIEPMITLQHFTLPKWVADRGGWTWEGMPAAFAKYTEVVRTRIGPDVHEWMTVNEPMIMLLLGYVDGLFPPGRDPHVAASMKLVVAPLKGLLRAHALAYHKLHEFDSKPGFVSAQVGVAHHLRIFEAKSAWNPLDHLAAWFADQSFNWVIPEAINTGVLKLNLPFIVSVDEEIPGLKDSQDYFGLNYYSRDQVHFDPFGSRGISVAMKEGADHADLDWEIYPEGLHELLVKIHQRYPALNIFISENGIADKSDQHRPEFILSHLRALRRAQMEGVPVTGYCHWSLYDNFEWTNGYQPRFGLYDVDYTTQKRSLRKSGQLFSEISQKNSF